MGTIKERSRLRPQGLNMRWHTDMVKLGKNNQASVLCGDPPSQSATDWY